MGRARTLFFVLVSLSLFGALIAGCGSSDRREGAIGIEQPGAAGVVQRGDPVLPAVAGYVGSERCSTCHPGQFLGWSRSLHNNPLKMIAELGDGIFVNDANGNGVNDFRDGLDFNDPATDNIIDPGSAGQALKNLRPRAPRLSFVNGAYLMTIDNTAFVIQRTQGGNGYWKQRYHTKVGKSYYVLPVQFNERKRNYQAYAEANWYDNNNVPLFTGAYADNTLVPQFAAFNDNVRRKGTATSWENLCSACHQTGLAVQTQRTRYGDNNVLEVVSGYSELNIGCERCHGPGATHVQTQNPGDIINPDNFRALGLTGHRTALQVCGQCHTRGTAVASLPGIQLRPDFPARVNTADNSLILPTPGTNILDNTAVGSLYYLLSQATTAYFGLNAPYFYQYGGWYTNYNFPRFIAPKQHRGQWVAQEQGPHSPDNTAKPLCWDCHNPHSPKGDPSREHDDDHMILQTVTRDGITINPRGEGTNNLCLSCHAADLGMTLSDVNSGAAVRTAVLNHMGKEAVMGPANDNIVYDPLGTEMGLCVKCHMPRTPVTASRTNIGGGIQEGDMHAHRFDIIWPNVFFQTQDNGDLVVGDNTVRTMPNSCFAGGCHFPGRGRASDTYIAEFSESGHADFAGPALRDWDEEPTKKVPSACTRCHTNQGFSDYVLDERLGPPRTPETALGCGTCHASQGRGRTLWDERATFVGLDNVLFPSGLRANLANSSNLCMTCHQGRASKVQVDGGIATNPNDDPILSFVNIHYFAAAATFFGTEVKGGYEYDNNSNVGPQTYQTRFLHTGSGGTRDTCTECHMNRAPEPNHTFFPRVSDCQPCHAIFLTPTDNTNPFRDVRLSSTEDFDGDGNNTEGLYFEIWDTLVPALLTAIQNYAAANMPPGIVYDPAAYPYWFKDTNGNRIADPGEKVNANRFNIFDATLLKAAYNFQVIQKEPCGYIHNARYHIQLLIDSIADLGGDVTGYTRPGSAGPPPAAPARARSLRTR